MLRSVLLKRVYRPVIRERREVRQGSLRRGLIQGYAPEIQGGLLLGRDLIGLLKSYRTYMNGISRMGQFFSGRTFP